MDANQLRLDLARVAHEFWRLGMQRDGWRPGPFDPRQRTHDALVPFEELGRGDKMAIALHLEASSIEPALTRGLSYPRGPERPFLVEEMREGLEVSLRGEGPAEAPARQIGVVARWRTDPSGELEEIEVHWPDGEISLHGAWEEELVRVAELG